MSDYKFTDKIKADIRKEIEYYCEGISYLEFSVDDFDNIINDIEVAVTKANEADTSQDKALHKHIVSGSVLPKYDCDDCRYYPCQTEPDSHGSQQRKIECGKCGDHSERCD